MLQRFAMLSIILFASLSFADVCSYITEQQAELGAKLLRINPDFIKYCAPCSEKSKTKIHAEKVEARPVEQYKYWGVFVNEENIDLAYTYLDIGENKGINLAKLSGCETPEDVPRLIDLTDATTPKPIPNALPPIKESQTPPTAKELQPLASAEDVLRDADQYFQKSDFRSTLRLYEEFLEKDPSKLNLLTPKLLKCYYNLGVQAMRKASLSGSRKECGLAADYFKQCLFLDQKDAIATEGLHLASMCKEVGPNLPRVQSEIENLKLRQ